MLFASRMGLHLFPMPGGIVLAATLPIVVFPRQRSRVPHIPDHKGTSVLLKTPLTFFEVRGKHFPLPCRFWEVVHSPNRHLLKRKTSSPALSLKPSIPLTWVMDNLSCTVLYQIWPSPYLGSDWLAPIVVGFGQTREDPFYRPSMLTFIKGLLHANYCANL